MITYKRNGAIRFISFFGWSVTIVKRKAPLGQTTYQKRKGRKYWTVFNRAWVHGYSVGLQDAIDTANNSD